MHVGVINVRVCAVGVGYTAQCFRAFVVWTNVVWTRVSKRCDTQVLHGVIVAHWFIVLETSGIVWEKYLLVEDSLV